MKYLLLIWPLLAVLALFSESVRKYVRWLFYEMPYVVWLLPAVFLANHISFCWLTGGYTKETTTSMLFLVGGALFCLLAMSDKQRITLIDWFTVLWFWLGWVLHFADRRRGRQFDLVDFDRSLIGISAVAMVLVYWVVVRRLNGLRVTYQFRKEDAVRALQELAWMVPVLLSIGFALGFFHPTLEYQALSARYNPIAAVFVRLADYHYVLDLIRTLLTVGLAEEILFRAGVQNFLDQRWGSTWRTLAVGSLIFGAAHLTSGQSQITLSTLNWRYGIMAAVAGVGYGRVYRRTSFLGFGMLVHAWIDVTKNYLL